MRFARHWMIASFAALLAGGGFGCQGRASIPSDAQLENSGSGKVSYTATQSGNVYVLDSDTNKKVFEGKANNGDQIVVEPDRDKIVIGGTDAPHDIALKPDHRYQIFFKPDR